MSKNSQFAISVFKIIIEESITAHRKRWEKVKQKKTQCRWRRKSSYPGRFKVRNSRGKEFILSGTRTVPSGNSFREWFVWSTMVQWTKTWNMEIQGYIFIPTPHINLYTQTSKHYRCTFLEYSQAPLVSPSHKSMKIEMYNEIYFQTIKVSVDRAMKDEESNQVDSESLKLHKNSPKIPSMT